MNSKRVFLDIHVIQTLPPSNMNRDDSGSPKTALYGGVRRARVSSQAWKKAMRDYFGKNSSEELGVRTKHVAAYVAEQIQSLDETMTYDEAFLLSQQALEGAGLKLDKKDRTSKALFFLGKRQAVYLAQIAIDNKDRITSKDVKEKLHSALGDCPEIDIALFGRMVADDPSLNEDASSQVAHAISTHAVQTEYDYYTAIDDMNPSDSAGAGMIGTIEFNSSTLYRYANVAVHELLNQLGDKDAVICAVKLFVESFTNSLPSGKMNTFANQTLPQVVMVDVRNDRPVSLVSAFENPVRADNGFAQNSAECLFDEHEKSKKFVNEPVCTLFVSEFDDKDIQSGKAETNMSALLDDLGSCLNSLL